MDKETSIEMCRGLAKAYSTAVRLYEGEESLFYYSVSHMRPDPLGPYLRQILDCGAEAGLITTALCQFYGFLTLPGGQRMILGPTRILQEDGKNTELLLAMLDIRREERENYLRLLRSAPIISGDRFAWLLASLMTALHGKAFPVEKVWFQIRPESSQRTIQSGYAQQQLDAANDEDIRQTVAQSYAWEQLVISYVENGQPELLRELFNAPPNIRAGRIAHDGLRQIKNMGICTATGVSRAAIQGGLDPQLAFSMSDLYIQKLELMRDVSTVSALYRQRQLSREEGQQHIRNAALSQIAWPDDARGEHDAGVQPFLRRLQHQRRGHGFALCVIAPDKLRGKGRRLRNFRALRLFRNRMDGADVDQLSNAALAAEFQNIPCAVHVDPVDSVARMRGH